MANLNRARWIAVFLGFLMGVGSVQAADFRSGDRVEINGKISDTLFSAGRDLRVSAASSDNLYLAAGRIALSARTPENVLAAAGSLSADGFSAGLGVLTGGQLNLRDSAVKHLILAGGTVELSKVKIEHEFIAAAGSIHLDAGSRVGGVAILAGGQLELMGEYAQDVRAYGKEVRIGGRIRGSLTTRAERLTIDPGTVIEGDLDYAAAEVTIAPQAVVKGKTHVRSFHPKWSEAKEGFQIAWIVVGVLFAMGMIALPALVAWVFPTTLDRGREILLGQFWQALGKGAALTLGGGGLWVLLLVTVVGAPLAFAVIPFFGVIKILGGATLAYTIGVWIRAKASRKSKGTKGAAKHPVRSRFLVLLIGGAVMAVVSAIPIIGSLTVFGFSLAGTGAFVIQFLERTKKQL